MTKVRQWFAVLGLSTFALAGCDTLTGEDSDQLTYNVEFNGGAVGDEPRSVLVARDILAAGGTAADAAVAMYATMSVTYPVAAGLGGGGLCLVYDPSGEGKIESLDFLPRAPISGGPYAVPGALRGMAALQGRYGQLSWEQIIGVAERMARFDAPASRAFVSRMKTVPGGLGQDPILLDLFSRGGAPLNEGANVQQFDLSGVLGAIRNRGAGDFYQGPTAQRFITAANSVGGRLTLEDMRRYAVQWQEAVTFETPTTITQVGGKTLILPSMEHVGARRAAWMWQFLRAQGLRYDMASGTRARNISRASARAMLMVSDPRSMSVGRVLNSELPTGPNVRLTEFGGATAFSTGDADGMSVSCVATMNGALGAKRVAPGTGIVLAPNVDPNEFDMAFAMPVMLVNPYTKQVFMSGGGSGGSPASVETVRVMADVILGRHLLQDALATSRLFHSGRPNAVFSEPGLTEEQLQAIATTGQSVPVSPYGRINMISCLGGMRSEPESCTMHKDPRGFGLSTADVF